jgi:serine/threonine-protein kinase
MSQTSVETDPLHDFGVPFGDLAVGKGFVTPQQVRECLDLQAKRTTEGETPRLGDLMVELGYLLPHQLEMILKEQKDSPLSKIKNYEMISRLGEGGMGYVMKARRLSDDQIVAMKVLFPKLASDEQYITRFQREAEIGLTLNHPNLVKCLEVGESGGLHYMALEFVDGEDLGELLQNRGYIAEAQSLAIMISVARGIAYAHNKGLVHRDIKPANVMLTRDGRVKVMDFGLARQSLGSEANHLTLTGILLGTPHYISPEQVEGQEELDGRSDIYSLGVSLFHMLTGRPPFIGGNIYEVLNDHVTERVPDPRRYNKAISPETASLVLWMTMREREQRPATMDRVVIELGRQLGLPSAKAQREDKPLPFRLTGMPEAAKQKTTQAMYAKIRQQLSCPRCKAEFHGDPVLLMKDQRIHCDACGLVFPCPIDPPKPLLPDEIQVEEAEEVEQALQDSSHINPAIRPSGTRISPGASVPEPIDDVVDDLEDSGANVKAIEAPQKPKTPLEMAMPILKIIGFLIAFSLIAWGTVWICQKILADILSSKS